METERWFIFIIGATIMYTGALMTGVEKDISRGVGLSILMVVLMIISIYSKFYLNKPLSKLKKI